MCSARNGVVFNGSVRRFANPSSRASKNVPFVIVLQSDLISETKTVVVAPLVTAENLRETQNLFPMVTIKGRRVAITVTELATMPRSLLKEPITTLDRERYRIVAALDLLFTGI